MPAIDVFYYAERFRGYNWERFLDTLAQEGAERFSVPDRKLDENDFSVVLHPVEKPSLLTHHVVIRIQLHAYPERVHEADGKARALAEKMSRELADDFGHSDFAVGVSLLLAEIGWGNDDARHQQP